MGQLDERRAAVPKSLPSRLKWNVGLVIAQSQQANSTSPTTFESSIPSFHFIYVHDCLMSAPFALLGMANATLPSNGIDRDSQAARPSYPTQLYEPELCPHPLTNGSDWSLTPVGCEEDVAFSLEGVSQAPVPTPLPILSPLPPLSEPPIQSHSGDVTAQIQLVALPLPLPLYTTPIVNAEPIDEKIRRSDPDTLTIEEALRIRAWLNQHSGIRQWETGKTNEIRMVYSCGHCLWPESALETLLKHVIDGHYPPRSRRHVMCPCGVLFASDEALQQHKLYDHYDDSELESIDKSGLLELTANALAIEKLEPPLKNLIERRSGNSNGSKGKMLNWIALQRTASFPGLLIRRCRSQTKNGLLRRLNRRVIMVCCPCGEPRFDMRQIAIHILGAHIDNPGFCCAECASTFISKDNLTRHVRKLHTKASNVPVPSEPEHDDQMYSTSIGGTEQEQGLAEQDAAVSGQDSAAQEPPPLDIDTTTILTAQTSIGSPVSNTISRIPRETLSDRPNPPAHLDDPERVGGSEQSAPTDDQIIQYLRTMTGSLTHEQVSHAYLVVPVHLSNDPLWRRSGRLHQVLLIMAALGAETLRGTNHSQMVQVSAPAPTNIQTTDLNSQPSHDDAPSSDPPLDLVPRPLEEFDIEAILHLLGVPPTLAYDPIPVASTSGSQIYPPDMYNGEPIVAQVTNAPPWISIDRMQDVQPDVESSGTSHNGDGSEYFNFDAYPVDIGTFLTDDYPPSIS